MDPLLSWVDEEVVRRLAAKLTEPARDPATPAAPDAAGFDKGFVGFTMEGSMPAEPTPATPPAAAAEPGASHVARQLPAPPAPASPSASGPFLEKIRRFRDWMRREFAADGVFILDDQGAVIFDDGPHERLHFLARSMAQASRRPGARTGNVHVKIGAATTLELIPVESAHGCLVLGAAVPVSLPPESVRVVMEALADIGSPPGR